MAEGPTPPGTEAPLPPGPLASRARRLAPFGIGAAGMLAVIGAVTLLTPKTPVLTHAEVDDAIASALASVTPAPAFSQVVYQQVQPSLVLIETDGGLSGPRPSGAPPPSGTPGASAAPDHAGLGSGVVINQDGDILTSLHVVEGSSTIDLTFADGSKSPGQIVATTPDKDIAVVHPTKPPPNIVPATLGNPGAVRQGTEAYALGSPFGLYGSVSAGVISGLDRSFKEPRTGRTLTGLFQIDAAVNPGNSGGALVDRDGRLIGIVTALVNPTDEDVFIGIGLAVPIDAAGGAAGLPPY